MFSGIKLIPSNFNINFIKTRYFNYSISLVIILGSFIGYFINGLNYGIDFSGGTLMEIRFLTPPNIGKLRYKLNNLKIGEVSLQEFGTNEDILIRIDQKDRNDNDQLKNINIVKETLGDKVEYRRIESIGPRMGQELINNCIQAVIWSLFAMLIYVWLRFEWHFGLCAIFALFHDACAVFGLYTVFGLEFNTTAIVAILITIGYSINDTVVIYDRIRENLKKFKMLDLDILLNNSINETLSRTILTSLSTIVALVALYLFGGSIIASYSLPILIGVAVGTYSSIFLASPLLLTTGFKIKKENKELDGFVNQNLPNGKI